MSYRQHHLQLRHTLKKGGRLNGLNDITKWIYAMLLTNGLHFGLKMLINYGYMAFFYTKKCCFCLISCWLVIALSVIKFPEFLSFQFKAVFNSI